MDTKETSDTPSDSYHLSLPELLEEELRSIEEQVALVGSAAVGYWATHKHSEETEKQKNRRMPPPTNSSTARAYSRA